MRGTPRKVDQLGRVVLPAEMRHELGWEEGTKVSVAVNGTAMLIERIEPACALCGATDGPLTIFNNKRLCDACIGRVKQIAWPAREGQHRG